LRISIVIINIVIVLFINLLLLQCNYAVVGKIFKGETSKYLYTYWGWSWLTFPIILCLLLYLLFCACDFVCFYYFNNLLNNKMWIQIHSGTWRFTDGPGTVNIEVPKKRIINTKIDVLRSPGKIKVSKSPGSKRI
jgi:hypothetical protein